MFNLTRSVIVISLQIIDEKTLIDQSVERMEEQMGQIRKSQTASFIIIIINQ